MHIILIFVGTLSAVGNLTVQSNGSCCHIISWTPPYTLLGVPILRYNINITQGTHFIQYSVTSTEMNYCPLQFGKYTVSVAAVNKVGEGKRNSTIQELESCENIILL